jgi:VWFA-related protein
MFFCLPFLMLLLQDQAIFRSDVALVRVDAEVRTETGTVSDLRRDSFRVTDNGVEQPIVYFAHDEQPLDVILLFDTSNSMRTVVARVAEAAHIAMGELRAGDRVAVMAFPPGTTDLIQDFTTDLGAAEHAVSENVLRRKTRCCSPIQSAVGAAARQFFKQHAQDRQQPRRRAIVAITDDRGTSVKRSALRDLEEADAIVLGVIVRRRLGILLSPYRGIREFARQTGGDMLDTRDAAEGIREMLNRLRMRYSLYYALPSSRPGERRTIKVELTAQAAGAQPGAIVRARTGYFAPVK